jgi:hypothetical protein
VSVIMKPYLFLRPERRKRGCYGVGLSPPDDEAESAMELKPQHCAMLFFSTDLLPEGFRFGRAYIQSEVGETFRPSQHEMRKFVRNMRRFAEQRKAATT